MGHKALSKCVCDKTSYYSQVRTVNLSDCNCMHSYSSYFQYMYGQNTFFFLGGGVVSANMQLGKCLIFRSCIFHDSCSYPWNISV